MLAPGPVVKLATTRSSKEIVKAFTISLDDLVVASFTTGPGANTLPIVVFSKVRLGLSPEVNALSAILMFALIIIGLFYFYFNKKFKH